MRYLLVLLTWACAALSTIPPGAEAATCTFEEGATQWGPIESLAGVGTNCVSPDGNDRYVIPDGAHVSIVEDVLFDGSSLGRIIVEAGGELVVDALLRSGGPGKIRLAVNEYLSCEPASTCRFQGAYREIGTAQPGVVATFEEAGLLETETVLACPGWHHAADRWESDCDGSLDGASDRSGNPNEVGLIWPHSTWTTSQPDPRHTLAALAEIAPGDVMCWADDDPETPETSTDENFCYEIVLANAAWDAAIDDVGVLIFDVRQTNPQNPRDTGYPLYLRQIVESHTIRAIAAGSSARRPTWIEVPTDVLPGTALVRGPPSGTGTTPRRERVGMFLRFADPQNEPREKSHRISRTWNDPEDGLAPIDCSAGPSTCDVLEFYDPRGLPFDQEAGDRLWIDYGHSPGEHFFVFTPIHFLEADGVQSYKTRALRLEGMIEFRGTIIEDTRVSLDGASGPFEDVWIRDPFSGAAPNAAILTFEDMSDFVVERFSSSGGASVGIDGSHGIVLRFNTDNIDFRHLGMRHSGDDFFSSIAPSIPDIDLYRVRAQYASGDAASMEFASDNGGTNILELKLEDVECVQCNSNDAFVNSGSINTVRNHEADGFLRWGTPGHYGFNTVSTVSNLLSIGSDHSLPYKVDRFVVAAADDLVGSAAGSQGLIENPHQEVQNGIIHDYSRDGYTLSSMDEGTLENVLFLDLAHLADCTLTECRAANLLAPDGSMEIDRVTFAARFDSTLELDSAVRANATGTPFTIEGLLVQGMTSSTGEGLGIKTSTAGKLAGFFANTTRGPCLSQNVNDVPVGFESSLPISTIQASTLDLSDPTQGRFDPVPGGTADSAECGIRSGVETPGIDRFRWIHSISHIVPEIQGDDVDEDGVPTDSGAEPCEDEEDERCADNCPLIFNPDQSDLNADGAGDVCSPECSNGLDDDGDGFVDFGFDPDCTDDLDDLELPEPTVATGLWIGIWGLSRLAARKALGTRAIVP